MPPQRRRRSQSSAGADLVAGIVGGLAGARRARREAQAAQQHAAAQAAWLHDRYERRLFEEQRRHRLANQLVDFLKLTPAEFEAAVGEILNHYGYDVRRTGGPGDLAVDLAGTNRRGQRVVVQCKRYGPGRRVGSPDLQRFIGMAFVEHRAQEALFVTTTEFTDEAWRLAVHTAGLVLLDGEALIKWAEGTRRPAGPPAPGWYANPGGPGLRWWDGYTWTDHTRQ